MRYVVKHNNINNMINNDLKFYLNYFEIFSLTMYY